MSPASFRDAGLRALGHRLSLRQMALLCHLAERGREAPIGSKALSLALGIPASATVRACDALCARGLMTRRKEPRNTKLRQLAITEEGAAVVAHILAGDTLQQQARAA